MSRILAIDYGKKRTGIAVSDTLQMIANGLTTVPTHELLTFILDYVGKEPVERILVGLPKQMNNEASENMKRIEMQYLTGISGNILARMGKNQYVSMETIEKICKKLVCTVDEMMEFTDDE